MFFSMVLCWGKLNVMLLNIMLLCLMVMGVLCLLCGLFFRWYICSSCLDVFIICWSWLYRFVSEFSGCVNIMLYNNKFMRLGILRVFELNFSMFMIIIIRIYNDVKNWINGESNVCKWNWWVLSVRILFECCLNLDDFVFFLLNVLINEIVLMFLFVCVREFVWCCINVWEIGCMLWFISFRMMYISGIRK